MGNEVRGIGLTPGVKPAVAQAFPQKLGFLQKKDVFFSQQSYRAQLTHFLSDVNEGPLVLSYGNADTDSFWNRLSPARHRDVIVLSPVKPEPVPYAKGPEEVLMGDDAENIRGTRKFILHNEIEPPPPPPDAVRLETLSGDKLEPALAYQLSEAYKNLKIDPETISWVAQHGQQLTVISAQHPSQVGFQKTEHPVLNTLIKSLAHLLAPVFGLKIERNSLQLPNGQAMPLEKTTWRNPEGQTVQMYQVRNLPDGTWLRLNSMPASRDLPLNNLKAIRLQISTQVDPWEKAGKVRDNQHIAAPAFTPDLAESAEANPFSALSTVTPVPSESFLY